MMERPKILLSALVNLVFYRKYAVSEYAASQEARPQAMHITLRSSTIAIAQWMRIELVHML
jgi:hypothetical protein